MEKTENKVIHNSVELMERIDEIGFLPLLNSGIPGYSAEEMVDEDCRYAVLPDGGWDWPLWKWKGEIITEGGHVYGKFFGGRAGFISRKWWPEFCNFRRKKYRAPEEGSIEEAILLTLAEHGSLITRELRALCGFNGPKMRSKFDSYITRLQMSTRIVTEDFVYPRDKHGHQYGWGWSLLTTPERLYGRDACRYDGDLSPMQSYFRLCEHLQKLYPEASHMKIRRLMK